MKKHVVVVDAVRILALVALLGLAILPASAAEPVAEVAGQPITLVELEAWAAEPLRELDRQRHQVLEQSLNKLIEQRLVEREAAQRGIDAEALLAAEVGSKVEAVTEADVDAWYTANQARLRRPKETVAEQIKAYLTEERSVKVRNAFIDGLRAEHAVKMHFEPLRVAIDNTSASPARGAAEAPVSLVVFSDLQCPACRQVNPSLEEVRETYGDKVRLVFRHFPLHNIHPEAQKAAEATLCAGDQGKFWAMHDALFEDQRALGVAQIKERAGELGLDTTAFNTCLDSGAHEATVLADLEAGQQIGVSGTPTIFINGRPVTLLRGASPVDQLAAVIDDELARMTAR